MRTQWFDNMPISRKVTVVILLTTATALVAAGVGVIATEIVIMRQTILENLRVTADLLGRNASAPLAFGREEDREEVRTALTALDANLYIVQASVYDRDGSVFATYDAHNDFASLPLTPPPDGYRFGSGNLLVIHPIHSGDRRVGTIIVRADLAVLQARAILHALIVGLILLLSIIVTVALSPRLRRPIAEPILALAAVARRIAHSRDYSARAVKRGNDEVGLLTDAFNHLIEEVGATQTSLQQANISMQAEIEERKAVERRLREAHDELKTAIAAAEAANQAKDDFLAVLSHELRTPLTPVLMALSLLEREPHLSDEGREEIESIRRHVELEARLIDDLLDLTRITRGKLTLQPEVTDLHRLIHDAARICCADRMDDLYLSLEAAEHHIHADAGRVLQVCWNLLNNAVKFTPAGGRITVSTSNPATGVIRMEVTDNGVGIEATILPKIFSAFEQGSSPVARRVGGLGLGLAISKALVEAHHGTIDVRSDGAGRGATFIVELATVAAPTPPTSQPPPQPPRDRARLHSRSTANRSDQGSPSASQPLRLLLVEDHSESLQLLSRLLRAGGYDVQAASSVAEALAIVEDHPVDLVISDLGLPDGTGLELMRKLRDRYGLRGICLSGYGMEEDIARSADAGFERHLTKPVDFQVLAEAIRTTAVG